MIKALFFTAALLVPSLAYSANPSGDLSVQVVPPSSNGIACDIGPNYKGTIPNPAAAMGFTTCLNFDFTYTGTFSNRVSFRDGNNVTRPAGQSYQWSNLSTWLDFAGASNPLFVYSFGNRVSGSYQTVTDSGKQVLLSQFIPGDNSPQIASLLYPTTNSFVEEVVKVDPNAYQNVTSTRNHEIIDDFGFFYNPGGGGLETDSGMVCADTTQASWNPPNVPRGPCNGNGGFVNGGGQPYFQPPGSTNLLDGNYHTTGMLTAASRTQGHVSFCGYYDGQYGVVNFDGPSDGNCWEFTNSSSNPACQTEPAGCYQMGQESLGSYVTGATATTARHWIQRLTVWTCPGWNTPSGGAGNNCDVGTKVPGTLTFGPSY
jgi:hypothetical protein